MKKHEIVLLFVCAVFIVGLISCSQQPQSENSTQAIQQSKELQTTEEKVKYLIKEANAFINSENFDQAMSVARYVLSELDKDSLEAKSIIEKAEAKLKELAAQKIEEAKGELQKKIGSFGQ